MTTITEQNQIDDFTESHLAELRRLVSLAKTRQIKYTECLEEARRHFAELAQLHKEIQKLSRPS